ncbi:hypothetical protein FQA47_000093 [Oryzias melastigma]|uniref:Uncharacterized protein n=1 Tax=Oryzias melastigma TaxID=30732 RepID=A0A834F3J2_ORYME|nr:hypothetical protein FQA47_000093 [Oryzias melastigma]
MRYTTASLASPMLHAASNPNLISKLLIHQTTPKPEQQAPRSLEDGENAPSCSADCPLSSNLPAGNIHKALFENRSPESRTVLISVKTKHWVSAPSLPHTHTITHTLTMLQCSCLLHNNKA